MSHIKPDNSTQLEEAIKWALSEEDTLEVLGAGSKKSLGRSITCDHQLDLSGLTGITLYEPEELVLSARAGTLLKEIEEALADENQYMAFEPLDYGPLLQGKPNSGTLGGTIACNLSGPRRLKVGAARDHFLGFSAVSGRGETFKSGGRVVKNVTGYDLMKLMAGSFGTLGVMSDITIKVLPAPNEEKSYLLSGLSDGQAMEAMSLALNSSCEISSAAHIPQALATRIDNLGIANLGADQAVTALRLEGHGPSVSYRAEKLATLLNNYGAGQLIDLDGSRALWRELRDGTLLGGKTGHSNWRISVPPKSGRDYIESLNIGQDARYFYDWGGGLIWLSLPGGDNASGLRKALEGISGHATLISSPEGCPDREIPNQPLGTGEHHLMRRIKENFDPKAILNPGRLFGDL